MSNDATPAGQLSDAALESVVGSHRRDAGVLGEGGPIVGLPPPAAEMVAPQHQNLAIQAAAPAAAAAGSQAGAAAAAAVVNSGW